MWWCVFHCLTMSDHYSVHNSRDSTQYFQASDMEQMTRVVSGSRSVSWRGCNSNRLEVASRMATAWQWIYVYVHIIYIYIYIYIYTYILYIYTYYIYICICICIYIYCCFQMESRNSSQHLQVFKHDKHSPPVHQVGDVNLRLEVPTELQKSVGVPHWSWANTSSMLTAVTAVNIEEIHWFYLFGQL